MAGRGSDSTIGASTGWRLRQRRPLSLPPPQKLPAHPKLRIRTLTHHPGTICIRAAVQSKSRGTDISDLNVVYRSACRSACKPTCKCLLHNSHMRVFDACSGIPLPRTAPVRPTKKMPRMQNIRQLLSSTENIPRMHTSPSTPNLRFVNQERLYEFSPCCTQSGGVGSSGLC